MGQPPQIPDRPQKRKMGILPSSAEMVGLCPRLVTTTSPPQPTDQALVTISANRSLTLPDLLGFRLVYLVRGHSAITQSNIWASRSVSSNDLRVFVLRNSPLQQGPRAPGVLVISHVLFLWHLKVFAAFGPLC